MPIGRRGPFTLQSGSTSKTDMAERAAEILTLTKMNWNSATFHMNDIVSFPFTGWNPAAYRLCATSLTSFTRRARIGGA